MCTLTLRKTYIRCLRDWSVSTTIKGLPQCDSIPMSRRDSGGVLNWTRIIAERHQSLGQLCVWSWLVFPVWRALSRANYVLFSFQSNAIVVAFYFLIWTKRNSVWFLIRRNSVWFLIRRRFSVLSFSLQFERELKPSSQNVYSTMPRAQLRPLGAMGPNWGPGPENIAAILYRWL